MAERTCLVDKKRMEYEGIFSVEELLSTLKQLAARKGYKRKDMSTTELVKKTGRHITHVFEFNKKLSDYATSVIKIKMDLQNITDVDIEKEGYTLNKNQGHAIFIFDAYLETSFEHKWENTPGFFFVRVLFDKYIFKPFTTNYQGMVVGDYKEVYNEIRGHLNLNKY